MKLYVVTEPESIRGIYDTWPACEAAVSGVPGARYQSVGSRTEAESILQGDSITLPPGVYAFIDGNHLGGVGIVFVKQRRGPPVTREISTSVMRVFLGSGLSSLSSRAAIREALERLRNVLAELGALYHVVNIIAPGTSFTVVHDYEGIGAWMERRWQVNDPQVREIVQSCQQAVSSRKLSITFHHQRAHQSSFLRNNEFAAYNAKADALATDGAAVDAAR